MDVNTTLLKERKSAREQKERKAIELQFEEPVNFKVLAPEEKEKTKEGSGKILTFNDQGILLLTDNPLKEGSFVNLSIKFKELGLLEGILGKIKKVEESEEHDFYVGVELYSPEKIKAEALSGLFPEEMESFNVRLKKSLIDYFKRTKNYPEKISGSNERLTY
ncbi:MAG: hypothetical protein A2W07_06975 [candidate division Zixibacteria bacterium RBG_16_43_9]|nr:MAG: hypothetical protein A2W07_06975 [candidate division Zixibacteria bacterium RBG_16_43_9]